jgi:hypothetical protein
MTDEVRQGPLRSTIPLIFERPLRMRLRSLGWAQHHSYQELRQTPVCLQSPILARPSEASLGHPLGAAAAPPVNYSGTNNREMAHCFALPKQSAGQY